MMHDCPHCGSGPCSCGTRPPTVVAEETLAIVTINPEMRLSVRRPAEEIVVLQVPEGGTVRALVGIENECACTGLPLARMRNAGYDSPAVLLHWPDTRLDGSERQTIEFELRGVEQGAWEVELEFQIRNEPMDLGGRSRLRFLVEVTPAQRHDPA